MSENGSTTGKTIDLDQGNALTIDLEELERTITAQQTDYWTRIEEWKRQWNDLSSMEERIEHGWKQGWVFDGFRIIEVWVAPADARQSYCFSPRGRFLFQSDLVYGSAAATLTNQIAIRQEEAADLMKWQKRLISEMDMTDEQKVEAGICPRCDQICVTQLALRQHNRYDRLKHRE